MPFLYNISISFYNFIILTASVFNSKAKLWIKGRKNIFRQIDQKINNADNVAWFHCASLGEFEQGRPVIEKFKEKHPELKILITFFSPSGYEIRKNYDKADYVFYLPIDTKKNAKRFIAIVKPKIAFFIKYEFWYNYLNQLNKNNIPSVVFSSVFRKDQIFFKWYGKWYRNILNSFNYIFVQDKKSLELLNSYNINNVSVAGDTRFDRVVDIAKKSTPIQKIESFKNNKLILIGGSTWEKDEELLIQYFNTTNHDIKLIIAPHEIDKKHINKIKTMLYRRHICLSEVNNENIKNADCLIIDSIGKLSAIYKYCEIAYIGGGFGKGIHNILEAAVFGMPVVFGPNYQKFNEAVNMINIKGATSINTYVELVKQLDNLINNEDVLKESAGISSDYVKQNSGAVNKILEEAGNI